LTPEIVHQDHRARFRAQKFRNPGYNPRIASPRQYQQNGTAVCLYSMPQIIGAANRQNRVVEDKFLGGLGRRPPRGTGHVRIQTGEACGARARRGFPCSVRQVREVPFDVERHVTHLTETGIAQIFKEGGAPLL
jgi:hypothetical protein